MRHQHQTLLVGLEVLLEPDTSLQVKMVGWLIKQQQRWRGKQRTGKCNTHAPATRHVLGAACHHVLGEAQAMEQLRGTDLERVWVNFLHALVDGLEALVFWTRRLQNLGLELLQASKLVLQVINDGLERRAVARLRLAIEVIQVHVIWNGYLTLGQAAQEIRFAGAVLPDEAVAPPNCQLNGAVLDKLRACQRHTETVNLDISRRRPGCQHPSHRPVHLVNGESAVGLRRKILDSSILLALRLLLRLLLGSLLHPVTGHDEAACLKVSCAAREASAKCPESATGRERATRAPHAGVAAASDNNSSAVSAEFQTKWFSLTRLKQAEMP
eukprot:361200-Chlamydomonas_euryale.AAC.20